MYLPCAMGATHLRLKNFERINMLEILQNPQAWLIAGGIFLLRVLNLAIATVRMLSMVRGLKTITWILGIFETLLFLFAIGTVLNDMSNPLNIAAYSVGFATGNIVGMIIEERLAFGYIQVSTISSRNGAAIAESLRDKGYAVTEVPARGKDGMVSLLECSVRRKNLEEVKRVIKETDKGAFVTTRDVRPLRRGYWRR